MNDSTDSWPLTPDSPRAGSLYHATTTIDDLTLALTNHSRVPSPEPEPSLTCCCGRDDCENTKGWLAFKTKLESRLVLSAEVGQALLSRHEAYVRQHEGDRSRSRDTEADLSVDGIDVDSRVAELIKQNAVLERRLTQALVDHEVKDNSHKHALQELEDARSTVSRLAAHHARTVGLDTRLMAVMREKDDMQQERDSEAQRAKVAEGRISALKERTTKLQTEVRRLQHDIESRRQHRLELSEDILHDARLRLETLQNYNPGQNVVEQENEVTKVLESLVADNENLKHDNAELQNLLTEAREDVRTLTEEVEEHRAGLPSGSNAGTPHSRNFFSGHVASSYEDETTYRTGRRPASVEPGSRRPFEPLTPETDHGRRALPPVDSLMPPDLQKPSLGHQASLGHHRRNPSSPNLSPEFSVNRQNDTGSPSPLRTPHKSLLLLSESKGVQTDSEPGTSRPSPMMQPHPYGDHLSASSPADGRSESSSMFDSNSSPVTIILERVTSLLLRMTQADALTLNNRLKRQNLKGADVKHLSRTTVGSILSDSTQLRSHFRAYLEDDNIPTACSRKDLRGLFKLFRECFEEMGQMRITLNDVLLDPSLAPKISEMALDPAKAAERERQAAKGSSWTNPLAKLFGSVTTSSATDSSPPVREAPPMTRALSRGRDTRQRGLVVPKMAPALAPTATTVNVDFSSGVARSMTTTPSQDLRRDQMRRTVSSTTASPPPTSQASFMGLFAGAPRPGPPADPWVVLPDSSNRRVNPSTLGLDPSATATLGRSAMRNAARLSQNVDAVIDVDSPAQDNEDTISPLLQRTLRRRGLSDSSIHSTFMSQADEPPPPVPTRQEAWPDRTGMLRSLSRTVKTFKSAAASTLATSPPQTADDVETPISSSPPRPSAIPETPEGAKRITSSSSSPAHAQPRSASPIVAFIPNLTSWAAAGETLDANGFTATPRDLHRNWGGRETQERDF